jgi:hypothetical protein
MAQTRGATAQAKSVYGTHSESLAVTVGAVSIMQWDAKFTYTFENFFHPFVSELISKLNRDSLPGMLDATWQDSLKTADPIADPQNDFFNNLYHPQSKLVQVNHFRKEIDVKSGPYANYNWELLFHVPLTIAVHLSKSQRFAEAQHWFHYIFDPTSNDQSIPPRERFWKFLAFRSPDDSMKIDDVLRLLSTPYSKLNPADQLLQQSVMEGYTAILNHPFQPHRVARNRHLAYQYSVVMKYLDNLIAWGDNLFQQDTIESINEATQRYVLAANLLGPRPQRIPPQGAVRPKTFAQLKADLGPIGDAVVELEGQFPFNHALPSSGSLGDADNSATLLGIGPTLYFCLPRNDKLLAYWDLVADRLFKIRHCMNIAGVVRPLALFDPPIDPAMLVKAAAAGIDIGSIISGLNQPIGPVRCLGLMQKASELCAEVRGLGGALLAALEKGDGEHLALIRQRHEVQIQQMQQEVRFLQWKSSEEATKSLLTSRRTALERLRYYQRLLGLPADQNAPDDLPLDSFELTEENFDSAFNALVGKYDKPLSLQKLAELKLAGGTSPAQQSGASGQGRLYLNVNENAELEHLASSLELRMMATVIDYISSALVYIPDLNLDLMFWGMGANSEIFGGKKLSDAGRFIAEIMRTKSTFEQDAAGMTSRTAGHERRADDWLLQYNLAAHELMQLGRQILTSRVAEAIAHHEYLNTQQQIKNSQEVDQFLHDKYTNEELHLWMQGEISRLYYEYYRFAFDTARKAERTMKHELMRPELDSQDFIKFNYWDGGRKGLLSGEALHLDVKRLEMAYHENNRRELELTRHVSLRQLNPIALMTLRATGSCQVTVPEWLYDRDCPGHYMRRIRSVAVSVPSVVGPYTSVNCTLSLLRSSLRKSPLPKEGEYARQGPEDDRFVDYTGAIQSIVTSSGSNDSGLFETNLRDERFLPFEGAGAESTWKLDLPANYRAFDYATISDVILHIRYTARQGVEPTKVKAALDAMFQDENQSNLALFFSLRHDFPTEWSAFVNRPGTDFTVAISRNYFPYFTVGKNIRIVNLDVYGPTVSKHHKLNNPATPFDFLSPQQKFDITAPEDAAGPDAVLKRSSDVQVFLLVRYAI